MKLRSIIFDVILNPALHQSAGWPHLNIPASLLLTVEGENVLTWLLWWRRKPFWGLIFHSACGLIKKYLLKIVTNLIFILLRNIRKCPWGVGTLRTLFWRITLERVTLLNHSLNSSEQLSKSFSFLNHLKHSHSKLFLLLLFFLLKQNITSCVRTLSSMVL